MKNLKSACILGTLSLGLVFSSHIATAHAGACCAKINSVYEEGIPCQCQMDQKTVKTTKTDCIDMQSFYSEGRAYPCNAGTGNNIVELAYSSGQGFFSEGLDYSGEQNSALVAHRRNALQAQPAAGNR